MDARESNVAESAQDAIVVKGARVHNLKGVSVTIPRVVGGALALVAVAISLQGGVLERVPWWMLVLPFLAGIGIAWQQATNGRLRQRVGTPLTATLVNFIGGTAILAVAALAHVAVVGAPAVWPTDPWLYLGGVIGVTYIFLSAALVVHTGVLILGLGAVAGQLVTAFVLDAAWPADAGPGWLAELVNEHHCGFAVPPDDPAAFADALERAAADRAELPRMGERARALARAQFDRAVLAAQWVRWLEGAAGADAAVPA